VGQLVVSLLLASLEDGYTAGLEPLQSVLLTNTNVQKGLQAPQVLRLLLTALVAKHEQCFRLLLQLPRVQQLQPEDFIILWRYLITAEAHHIHQQQQHHLLPVIVKHMPDAALPLLPFQWRTVYNFLNSALRQCDCSALRLYMQRMPAAVAAIPTERLVKMLRTAMPTCPAAFHALSSLPGFQQLSSDLVTGLFTQMAQVASCLAKPTGTPQALTAASRTAHDMEFEACVKVLSGLPQASHVQTRRIGLLSVLLKMPGQPAVAEVCSLLERSLRHVQEQQQPEGQQQEQKGPGWRGKPLAFSVDQLLRSALPNLSKPICFASSGGMAGLERLCSMQCIKDTVDVKTINMQLKDALSMFCSHDWPEVFCMCPDPAAAAASSSAGSVRLLLGLPAAARITSHQLALHIGRVLLQCCDDDVCEALVEELLCSSNGRLPGPSTVMRLLLSCLDRKTGRSIVTCMQLLCGDLAAQQLHAGNVLELLQGALELQQASVAVLRVVTVQCQLPASAQLTGEQVQQLLAAAVTISSKLTDLHSAAATDSISQLVSMLCELPGAQGLQSSQLSQLLEAALKGSCYKAIKMICALPGAQGMSAEQLAVLLAAAKEAGAPFGTVLPLFQRPLAPKLAVCGSSTGRQCISASEGVGEQLVCATGLQQQVQRIAEQGADGEAQHSKEWGEQRTDD
jgi:hypothetical protein